MPPKCRKAARRQSYNIRDLMLAIIFVLCVLSIFWGYGWAYQSGYDAAAHYYTEVHHG